MATKSNLWLKADSANSKIAQLTKKYNEIVNQANNISKTVNDTVGKNGKWYDENAAIFANWWNQSKSSSITGGSLKYDETNQRLQIVGGSASDGEDKIKFILQLAGKIFYIGVCAQMNTLYSSNKKAIDSKKKLQAAAKLGKNKTYQEKVSGNSVSGTKLSKMMEDNFGATRWASVKLNITPLGVSNTNDEALSNMATELKNYLEKLDKAMEAFCKEMKNVVSNTDKSIWWGCSDAANIQASINEYNTKADNYMKAFRNSVTEAIMASSGEVTKQITDLKNLTF